VASTEFVYRTDLSNMTMLLAAFPGHLLGHHTTNQSELLVPHKGVIHTADHEAAVLANKDTHSTRSASQFCTPLFLATEFKPWPS